MEVIRYVLNLLDSSHPNPALIPDMKNSSRLDNLGSSMLSAKATIVLTF